MRKKLLISACLAFGATTSLWAGIISVDPLSPSVTVGQTFTLSVDISGAADLYAWQFDLGFDPSVLQAISVTEGPFLATGGATIFDPGTIDNAGGTISNNGDSLETAVSGVDGNGDLLDVTFEALAQGTSTVPVFNLFALDSLGLGLDETTSSSTVTVIASAAPEPGTWLLSGLGTLALIAFRRRRT